MSRIRGPAARWFGSQGGKKYFRRAGLGGFPSSGSPRSDPRSRPPLSYRLARLFLVLRRRALPTLHAPSAGVWLSLSSVRFSSNPERGRIVRNVPCALCARKYVRRAETAALFPSRPRIFFVFRYVSRAADSAIRAGMVFDISSRFSRPHLCPRPPTPECGLVIVRKDGVSRKNAALRKPSIFPSYSASKTGLFRDRIF
jgi:hypothetical protein